MYWTQQDLAQTVRVSLSLSVLIYCVWGWFFTPSPLFLDEGLQMSVYSKSYVALQAPQWTHLPACVSMETQFVRAPLQLVSLTSISAEGHLAWAHTYTESQPQRWEKIVKEDLRAWDLSETTLQDCGKLYGVMAFIWILGNGQNKQTKRFTLGTLRWTKAAAISGNCRANHVYFMSVATISILLNLKQVFFDC